MSSSIPEEDAQRLVARSAPRPAQRGSARTRAVLALDDLERLARRHLPRCVHGFVAGGAETEASLRANRAAFADHALLPRVLIDTAGRSQRRTLLGQEWAAPFGIAPMGGSAVAAYRGDAVLAAAAERASIPFVLSAASLIPMEEVARINPAAWFQAYLPGEPARILSLLERVGRAGFGTLMLTVDLPVPGNRENNERNGWSMPLRPTPRLLLDGLAHPRWLLGTALRTLARHGMPHFENMDAERGPPIVSRSLVRAVGQRDRLTWDHVALMRDRWQGRFVLKGILSPEDARIARARGVDGIVVSNHGGRQLDGALAPLRALPAIVAEAGPMAVMLDGGIRRGTDVAKALMLGADLVFLGRPFLYAAAIGGGEMVDHAIGLLGEEIDRTMALLGLTRLGPEAADRLVPAWDAATLDQRTANP
ncbi:MULTISPECIES: alpha-hydroxy acid oxidase [unclassified Methylobacterium]|uniref:alpha-hydroxy acid oxidase n=1 Tax=unclassified Methylobacterium TaxID=2615210 RepID=UPI000CB11CB6|nr:MULTISPECIES: alpha-hydroxy acid oxidase [unclassified Methylobacterium]PIU05529.1 MAG: alpha-hydroxy-acid oxidizing enzyme [Methylobacterium sp. CG09_land_8_20_14_0_10_71_15]PIU13600.1 MAG: alpha-hydroxy-acid oxidizing enzyme [Methylobacterium sp. CG08_land_8_20_14_0_20_71_15]GBU17035.1 alpha-hydroxy-acid oxidizing enzyme [Methylobacterium sp.]